jgi:hypothetical protein
VSVWRRCRVHHSADNLMSLTFSESWWLPNWNMLNRCKSHFGREKSKKREKKIETDVPVVSGETDKNPKSERSYWLDQRQLLMFEKDDTPFSLILLFFFLSTWMSKRSAPDCWG